mmetsp:Transcript_21727/g.70197  ORF Transcript_21727/g.70197 Transcript_21727/m.70197 type:complete len:105 (+) Transcript_21727:1107-1421(+)
MAPKIAAASAKSEMHNFVRRQRQHRGDPGAVRARRSRGGDAALDEQQPSTAVAFVRWIEAAAVHHYEGHYDGAAHNCFAFDMALGHGNMLNYIAEGPQVGEQHL